MWTSREVSHPKQKLLYPFCLFLCCCFFTFVVVFLLFFLWWHYTCILSVKDNIFYYTHFEIIYGPCRLALIDAIYSQIGPFFCFKSHPFSSQRGGYIKNKTTNQISRLFESNHPNCRKMRDKEYHMANFATFAYKILTSPPPKKKKKNWMNLISDPHSTASIKYLTWPSPVFGRFENGCNKVVIEPRVMQFWSEIVLVISNRTQAQIALHSVQLPLWIKVLKWNFFMEIVPLSTSLPQQLSQLFQCFHVFFRFFVFVLFVLFFLMSYTPNF